MSNKSKIPPIVIGLVGAGGSGKDTVASYLKRKYGAEEFRFSYLLDKALKIFHIEPSRENFIWLMLTLKEKFGEDVLTKAMAKTIIELSKSSMVIINGLRLPPDYDWIRSFKKNSLVYLVAPLETRWKRVRKRKEKTDDGVSLAKFKELNETLTEKHIEDLGKKADYLIVNEGELKDLYQSIDKVVEKILRSSSPM